MFRTTQQGIVRIISGDAPLTGDNIAAARKVCAGATVRGQPKLAIDFSGIPLIDSAGLELLLEIRDLCSQRGGVVVVAGANALCLDILRATGVAAEIAIFDDLVSAAGSFAQ